MAKDREGSPRVKKGLRRPRISPSVSDHDGLTSPSRRSRRMPCRDRVRRGRGKARPQTASERAHAAWNVDSSSPKPERPERVAMDLTLLNRFSLLAHILAGPVATDAPAVVVRRSVRPIRGSNGTRSRSRDGSADGAGLRVRPGACLPLRPSEVARDRLRNHGFLHDRLRRNPLNLNEPLEDPRPPVPPILARRDLERDHDEVEKENRGGVLLTPSAGAVSSTPRPRFYSPSLSSCLRKGEMS